ncbi:acyl-CoA dehydrogenase family protein [Marinomonas mediterranea]|jgi:Acyl-CoA dehydrogenases|uniref:Acyl-CoA dehydrogenase domain-containing protein n=1 Tax=Marinomonas mediterranea (strain ATCC 700492 / JCM 21426 / NBRC 103028 / MMB-1) TaxID=717774 RepID=F2K0S1_MARM1|nr:acyl-CoA dehydrogenase family protein [Marinomonas mediterranea]ADZ92163.1 acyl-CoA dehydrogenase domain-containing protein [Marinomonas mediterranea MMB-1]WCN18225.1 acyl-CoA dehydrogenase [Marinomonas mediterranea MMB-1]
MSNYSQDSVSAEALKAAGDSAQAEDVSVLEAAANAADRRLAATKSSLVERMIYGPQPDIEELCSGGKNMKSSVTEEAQEILHEAMECLNKGEAFGTDGKITSELRHSVAKKGAYGFTVPTEYGGKGKRYSEFACLTEEFASQGLGALSVEISGQLTIGSSALLGYGTSFQKSQYLPSISSGQLIAFALTEVGVGVNAKRVQAYVEADEENKCWRLYAEGERNKLYITSATHGGLMAIVARKGKSSKELALFIVELPEEDIDAEFSFSCKSSNVSAFQQNINSRISFRHFPIPYEQEIQGNGVEVLFYCLRMGRCMLAAQAAGFQRMMASDAAYYAQKREGVGGKVIKHELPRLGLVKILGGALTAQALSHLSLAQDQDRVDLAGLRDVTKSASAHYLLESLIACERVMGGRSLDKGSRISDIRATAHAFGIVEGEDDLIRLGMVRDLTKRFTTDYMSGLLNVLQKTNLDKGGNSLPADKRILRLNVAAFMAYPLRSINIVLSLVMKPDFWKLSGWVVENALERVKAGITKVIPTCFNSRYRKIPKMFRNHIRYAERELKRCRWDYFKISLVYQLELTRAQIPLQRLGQKIETLMCIATLCGHASQLDKSSQRVALAQIEILRSKLDGGNASTRRIDRLRKAVSLVVEDVMRGENALINKVEPQHYAHPWEDE